MANLSKTLRISFYQNRSSIVEVTIKKFWCVFLSHSVESLAYIFAADSMGLSSFNFCGLRKTHKKILVCFFMPLGVNVLVMSQIYMFHSE